MCLDYELTKPKADKIKAEARKRGYIRVWKICSEKRTGWYYAKKWKEGLRKAANLKYSNGGWYAYLTLKGARKELREKELRDWLDDCEIKTCYAKPQWIKRLGGNDSGRIGIFTHLAFPDWDKGVMTIREFRDMCKGKP